MRFALPDLPARPGVVLLSADTVTVQGRLDEPVSIALESGSRLVITGPNGSGKSTLLRVLAGHQSPTSGQVHRSRTARIALLAQESPWTQESPDQPVRSPRQLFDRHIARLISAELLAERDAVALTSLGLMSGADLNRPVRELSTGQQRRLDLALTLATRPHGLLLDEPTNHLSIALVDELTTALQATDATVAVASHDRQLLEDVGDWPTLELPGSTRQSVTDTPQKGGQE